MALACISHLNLSYSLDVLDFVEPLFHPLAGPQRAVLLVLHFDHFGEGALADFAQHRIFPLLPVDFVLVLLRFGGGTFHRDAGLRSHRFDHE